MSLVRKQAAYFLDPFHQLRTSEPTRVGGGLVRNKSEQLVVRRLHRTLSEHLNQTDDLHSQLVTNSLVSSMSRLVLKSISDNKH